MRTAAITDLEPARPLPLLDVEAREWSQNGEDGVIAWLVEQLRPPVTQYFVEIGCGSGKENNTSALVARGWSGSVFEAKAARVANYRARGWWRVKAYHMEVAAAGIHRVLKRVAPDPAVFSLDVDSTDWWIMRAMMANGFRPAIAVLEYNAALGEAPVTVPESYRVVPGLKDQYYGCSAAAWAALLEPQGYAFVGCESQGVNAFFIRRELLRAPLVRRGARWVENAHQRARFGSVRDIQDHIRCAGVQLVDVRGVQ